jgi:hypothetical protein
LFVVGYLLLAVGCWLLAVGCWPLAVSRLLFAVGCWLLAVKQKKTYYILKIFVAPFRDGVKQQRF